MTGFDSSASSGASRKLIGEKLANVALGAPSAKKFDPLEAALADRLTIDRGRI